MKRERKKSIVAVIIIAILFLIAGYIEVEAGDKKKRSRAIIVPNTGSKQIIVMEDKTSTTIIDLTKHTIQFCSSTDGSLVICQDLGVKRSK